MIYGMRRIAAVAAVLCSCASAPRGGLLARVTQLTFGGERSGEAYFDPAGRRIVFQSEREPGNPFYQMYVLDRATGRIERISPGTGKTTCGWFLPDGRILFASTHHDPASVRLQQEEIERRRRGPPRRYAWEFDPEFEIYAYDPRTGALENLTRSPGYDAEGAGSPDGSLIVFASNRHDPRPDGSTVDLYVMGGGGVRRLTDEPGYDGGPFFSPDGTRIVWRRFSADGRRSEVWIMDSDGSRARQVTRLGAVSWAPFFHPSGDYIVFCSDAAGRHEYELYIVDTPGLGSPVRVTYHPGFDGLPAFSPDGGALAWTRTAPDGKTQIFLADWNDGEARRLLGLPPPSRLETHVETLASRLMEGRLAGTEGERRAAKYIAAVFRRIGLEVRVEPFEFPAGAEPGPRCRAAVGGRELAVGADWEPLGFSAEGSFGPAVAVKDDPHADVAGKWLVAEGEPRRLARVARERGALGLIVSGGRPVRYSGSPAEIPVLWMREPSAALGAALEATVELARRTATARNVIARLRVPEATGPPVVVGAHFDHLGRGEAGGSLAKPEGRGEIHPGADDNASGVAVVLEVARALAADPARLRRDVIFAAWSAEEIGLLGSARFAGAERAFAYVNLDMVGRLRDVLLVQGTDSSPAWAQLVGAANAAVRLPVALRGDPWVPSDATSFYRFEVPVVSLFTGAHAEYHTPGDRPGLVNYEGMRRITRFVERLVRLLGERGEPMPYVRLEPKPKEGGPMRAYFGTMPDYGFEGPGVRLSDVIRDGPAARAGLRAGDVLVRIADREIRDVQDYADALRELAPGRSVEVRVLRDGREISLTIIPSRR